MQGEAELALLSNDELAASTASLALREEEGYSSGGSPSPTRRWLGRALPGSPSRLSRGRSSKPGAAPPGAPPAAHLAAAANGSVAVAPPVGGAAAGAAVVVPPLVEAAQRLTQLLDSVINLLAGAAARPSGLSTCSRASCLYGPCRWWQPLLLLWALLPNTGWGGGSPFNPACHAHPVLPPACPSRRCSHGSRGLGGQSAAVPARGSGRDDGPRGAHAAGAAGGS